MRRTARAAALALAACLVATGSALLADQADVLEVAIRALGQDQYRVDATVRHRDQGWNHYADRWDVLDTSGEILGSRELLHPHDNEQPFTRSLTLTIPRKVTHITVRAHDSVHGLGGQTVEIAVPR